MSYCRGIIYVVSETGGFVCYSSLHNRPFRTNSHRTMVEHLAEHQEDAREILQSIEKASDRLVSEMDKEENMPSERTAR